MNKSKNDSILFYSTNLKAPHVPFREALLKGIAPDRGLYMPQHIPLLPAEIMKSMPEMAYYEIAYQICRPFLQGQISDEELKALARDAYNYEIPLERAYERKYVMRLDQGPTASFKDFAARMMGRLMQTYLKRENRGILILTATSGDTGSAIANAFYSLDNIKVLVLFPEREVTARQRKQMTTLGKNVQIVSVDGKFDDCQALVKRAFADQDLDILNLSSANSINIGRLLPQAVYYFYAYSRLCDTANAETIVFSVPSGNFGDMMGGLIAYKMGLPVKQFVIATNENDEFVHFLNKEAYKKIVPSRNCLSSAMNVGHPSNLSRVVALFGGMMDEDGIIHATPDFDAMRRIMTAVSIDDRGTTKTIFDAHKAHQLLLEPHGAVGWAGLMDYLSRGFDDAEAVYVSLETAHPAKFPEQIREILNIDPPLPPSLHGIEEKSESYDNIENNYKQFKDYLNDKYS